MVSIITDHNDFVGDIILIEKLRPLEKNIDFFHQNFNLVLLGSKRLGLYSGI